MCEVDPRGGIPGLGWGCEEGLGGGCRGLQVGWHGGVPCLGLCLPKLAQIDLASGATCTHICMHWKRPWAASMGLSTDAIACKDVIQQKMKLLQACWPDKYDSLQIANFFLSSVLALSASIFEQV